MTFDDMDNSEKVGFCLGITILALALLIFIPMVFLWAVNVLIVGAGGAIIALSFKTWFASLLILMLVGGGGAAARSSS